MGRQEVLAEIAARVRAALALRGRSRLWLSRTTGIPKLDRKLDGHYDFTLTELAAIAAALDVSGSSLLPNVLGREESVDR